ncbi:MAG: EF-hand domain-containing protein [Pseudomonadota bacterium]|nr:MAG: EF-hand domain-containing protein [Pseudomonadota bacterium]
MRKTLLTMLLVFGVSAISVMAGEAGKAFSDLDQDGDGYISRSEATARSDLREHWATVDANKDGQLTESEFSAFEQVPTDTFPEK